MDLTAPQQWPWALASPPVVSSATTNWRGALLCRWRGTSAVMVQPPLDQHYVVMHLGGPKHVTRRHDGPSVSTVAENGSLTLVPAGTAYTWRTQGPIAFAHLYIPPRRLEDCVAAEFDGEARGAWLIERVGCRDPLLEPLLARMLVEVQAEAHASKLLLDALLETLMIRLAQKYASGPVARALRAVALAPHRLRRVVEFIDANLGRDIALADLVDAATTSQYHFSRAFHLATGCSPYRYLTHRRIAYARVLLLTGTQSLEAISASCGFNSARQFAVMFKRSVGVGPKRFRLAFAPLGQRRAAAESKPIAAPG